MSGGTFGYLSSSMEVPYNLYQMRDELIRIAPDSSAAIDTASLIALMERRISELEDVWHDVEWYRSGDYTFDRALRTIRDYEMTKDSDSDSDSDLGAIESESPERE